MASRAASVLSEGQLDAALKALASAQRRAIVRLLLEHSASGAKECCGSEEVCACKLSERLGLAESTISHHMSALKRAGIVTARKDGTWVYYTVQRDVLNAVAHAIAGM